MPREYNVDPLDEGNLPSEFMPLSRMMARVLRHSGRSAGLIIDAEGWCSLTAMLRLPDLSGWRQEDVHTVVQESFSKTRPRFELKGSGESLQIRATHKHSFDQRSVPRGAPQRPSPTPGRVPAPTQSRNVPSTTPVGVSSVQSKHEDYLAPPPLRAATPQHFPGPGVRQDRPQEGTEEAVAGHASNARNLESADPRASATIPKASDPWAKGLDPWKTSTGQGLRPPPAAAKGPKPKPPECPGLAPQMQGPKQAPPQCPLPAPGVPGYKPPPPRFQSRPGAAAGPSKAAPPQLPPGCGVLPSGMPASPPMQQPAAPKGPCVGLAPGPKPTDDAAQPVPAAAQPSPVPSQPASNGAQALAACAAAPATAAATAPAGLAVSQPGSGAPEPTGAMAPTQPATPQPAPSAAQPAATAQPATAAAQPGHVAQAPESSAAGTSQTVQRPGYSSSLRLWTPYTLPAEQGAGLWWSCDEAWFMESDPGRWTKYTDPNAARQYWYNEETAEWFYVA